MNNTPTKQWCISFVVCDKSGNEPSSVYWSNTGPSSRESPAFLGETKNMKKRWCGPLMLWWSIGTVCPLRPVLPSRTCHVLVLLTSSTDFYCSLLVLHCLLLWSKWSKRYFCSMYPPTLSLVQFDWAAITTVVPFGGQYSWCLKLRSNS